MLFIFLPPAVNCARFWHTPRNSNEKNLKLMHHCPIFHAMLFFDNIVLIISFSGQKISKAGKSILQGLLKNQQFQRSDFINLGYGLLSGKLVQLPLSAAKPKFIEVHFDFTSFVLNFFICIWNILNYFHEFIFS